MQAALSLFLLAALCAVGLVALRLRTSLAAARASAAQAEAVAAARGRCLRLGGQELRGLAARLADGRGSGSDQESPWAGLGGTAIEGPAHQLLRLADDLDAAARRPGAPAIHEAPAALGPIVEAAIATVARQIRPGARQWQVDAALRALVVRADRRALEGALAALLRRAASHSRDGDTVVLRGVVASETVAIVVEDEGDGLVAADLVPEVPVPGTRGLDLGLSLARSLAVAHGGDIRLESAPGIGARAWLTLPRRRLLEPA
ncbi:sensor histidine kinase [Falsiroseomonas oryziterrae]|uniref:sensor histidine kinase n=1 Tax=Falsiroseomonas oryziterrae TaxID=2911368 RepID=UPI001F41BD68|nr:ATP-binding protein [Roseomonas sp. NPKOSM-4]